MDIIDRYQNLGLLSTEFLGVKNTIMSEYRRAMSNASELFNKQDFKINSLPFEKLYLYIHGYDTVYVRNLNKLYQMIGTVMDKTMDWDFDTSGDKIKDLYNNTLTKLNPLIHALNEHSLKILKHLKIKAIGNIVWVGCNINEEGTELVGIELEDHDDNNINCVLTTTSFRLSDDFIYEDEDIDDLRNSVSDMINVNYKYDTMIQEFIKIQEKINKLSKKQRKLVYDLPIGMASEYIENVLFPPRLMKDEYIEKLIEKL